MDENIFLFVPNIIGFTRVVLALASFYFMPTSPGLAVTLYLVSGFLDAVDGHAARYFNQSTKFGAILDMLTDRCVTACLLVVLAHFYPKYMFIFQFIICLDISSHWIHVYSSQLKGDISHKKIDLSGNPFLRLYYTNRVVLFTFCACNELFFSMLYLIYFTSGPIIHLGGISFGLWVFIAYITAPISVLKNVLSILQLVAASVNIGYIDVAERNKSKQ